MHCVSNHVKNFVSSLSSPYSFLFFSLLYTNNRLGDQNWEHLVLFIVLYPSQSSTSVDQNVSCCFLLNVVEDQDWMWEENGPWKKLTSHKNRNRKIVWENKNWKFQQYSHSREHNLMCLPQRITNYIPEWKIDVPASF